MKIAKSVSLVCLMAVALGVADSASAVNMTPQIQRLVNEKQEKMAALEKCEGKKKGFMIAGISTIGLTAVGVAGNIILANKSNKLSDELENKNTELSKKQDELSVINAKLAASKVDPRLSEDKAGTAANLECSEKIKKYPGVYVKDRGACYVSKICGKVSFTNPVPFHDITIKCGNKDGYGLFRDGRVGDGYIEDLRIDKLCIENVRSGTKCVVSAEHINGYNLTKTVTIDDIVETGGVRIDAPSPSSRVCGTVIYETKELVFGVDAICGNGNEYDYILYSNWCADSEGPVDYNLKVCPGSGFDGRFCIDDVPAGADCIFREFKSSGEACYKHIPIDEIKRTGKAEMQSGPDCDV